MHLASREPPREDLHEYQEFEKTGAIFAGELADFSWAVPEIADTKPNEHDGALWLSHLYGELRERRLSKASKE